MAKSKNQNTAPRQTWVGYYTRKTPNKAETLRKADRKAKQKGWQ